MNYHTRGDVPVLCTLGFIGNGGLLQIFSGAAAKKMPPPAAPMDGSPLRLPPRGSDWMRLLKLHNIKTLELFDFGTHFTRPKAVM